jgi:hypothetical protein
VKGTEKESEKLDVEDEIKKKSDIVHQINRYKPKEYKGTLNKRHNRK